MPHMPRHKKRKYEKTAPIRGRKEEADVEIPANFYSLNKWKKDRNAHIHANPFCVECLKIGLHVLATVSDHIQPISQGGAIWDWENRQGLCEIHHNKKRRFERRKNNT